MTLKALLFDLGGTLVNSQRGTEEAVRVVYSYLRLKTAPPISESEAISRWWSIWTEVLPEEIKMKDKMRKIMKIFLEELGVSSALIDEYLEIFVAEEINRTLTFPDVHPVLQYFRKRGLKMGVISNCSERWGRETLERNDLRKYFDVTLLSDVEGVAKPSKEAFMRALRRLNVEPSSALMVGDDLKNDVIGARGSGLMSCLILRERSPERETGPAPDFVVKDLFELKEIVDRVLR